MDGGPCGRSRSVTSTSKSSHARRQRPLKKKKKKNAFLKKITKTAKQDVCNRNYLNASKCIQKAASPPLLKLLIPNLMASLKPIERVGHKQQKIVLRAGA